MPTPRSAPYRGSIDRPDVTRPAVAPIALDALVVVSIFAAVLTMSRWAQLVELMATHVLGFPRVP